VEIRNSQQNLSFGLNKKQFAKVMKEHGLKQELVHLAGDYKAVDIVNNKGHIVSVASVKDGLQGKFFLASTAEKTYAGAKKALNKLIQQIKPNDELAVRNPNYKMMSDNVSEKKSSIVIGKIKKH